MLELGSRERSLPAPSHIVWGSLTAPRAPSARPWLELLDDELEPSVVDAVRPSLVVWSSLWPSRPDDRIRFDLRPIPDQTGSLLRWTLSTAADAPDDSKLGHMRYRLNLLINERLRLSYGH